jgi:hypothetical protein
MAERAPNPSRPQNELSRAANLSPKIEAHGARQGRRLWRRNAVVLTLATIEASFAARSMNGQNQRQIKNLLSEAIGREPQSTGRKYYWRHGISYLTQ